MKQTVGILLFLFLGTGMIMAQSGTVRGSIFDRDSGEPISFATVQLSGTSIGATSDLDGFFSIGNVPVGDYRLVATYIGYDSVSVDITVGAGKIVNERLVMSEGGIDLVTVNVSAEKAKAQNEVNISSVTLTPKQIRALPATGGEPDIAQFLSVIPGVISTGDQGGQIYIRGGSPIQNKILLDGTTIYNAFHSIGLFSVFETEAVRSVEVLTGGFNSEHGGRISAVVDIKTREGNKKRFAGKVSASPFLAKALIEGPIIKLKEDTGTSASFLLTGKRAYIDQTSTALYSNLPDSLGLPYNFTDLYGKFSLVTGNGTKLNAFGFNFEDQANFTNVADIGWSTAGGGINFTLVPASSAMIVGGNLSFSNYQVDLIESDNRPRSSSISDFLASLDFTYFGRNSEVKYGFQVNAINTDFRFQNIFDNTIEQTSFNTEISAFVNYQHKFGRLIIEPGARLMYYASLPELSLEPRMGLKYNISDNIRFKFAGGLYTQNLISSVNERDITNLFVGFLAGPDEQIFQLNTDELADNKLQRSWHAVAGVEVDVSERLSVNVEPYLKEFSQLININRNKTEPTDPDYATETGEAYGIDFLIKYNSPSFYFWGTYSLGYVRRDDGEQVYPTIFDRRHNVNLLATYTLGDDREWEFSARWNLGSGFPFTLTQGFYNFNNFNEGLDTEFLTDNPEDVGIIYDERRNAGRLPFYHRLDASVKRTFTFTKYTKLEVIASVTNLYDRRNIFFFDRVEYDRVDQLPVLPSLGMSLSF
ncbi:MAG: carboxypeptidase-like regulatory domain-containing protein [Bacteroidota bacterium]